MNEIRKSLRLGQRIKGNSGTTYIVRNLLGSGGTGFVYLCENESEKKFYAIKELYPKEIGFSLMRDTESGVLKIHEKFESDAICDKFNWYKENIQREFSLHYHATQSRIKTNNDPFFLKCISLFEANGTAYIVYDTQCGKTLNVYVEESQNKCDKREYLISILSTAIVTAKKIACIHDSGILHLDISPLNVFLIDHGDGDVPYLLDFGSAFEMNSDAEIEHRFSTTEGFSAPELYCRSEGNYEGYPVSMATDTYSIVAILFYALYGKTYDERCIWGLEKWQEKINTYPESEQIVAIINKGLDDTQRRRYQTANELAEDLLELRAKLCGGNGDMKPIIESISNLNLRLTKVEETINTVISQNHLTLDAQIKTLFNAVDCILQTDEPNHSTHGSKKNVPLTRYAFLSLCMYNAPDDRYSLHLIAKHHVENLLAHKNSVENLNKTIESEARKKSGNPILKELHAKKYEFFYEKHTNKICIRCKEKIKREFSESAYLETMELLFKSYMHLGMFHEKYDHSLKIELNYTVSEYIAALAFKRFFAHAPNMKARFFEMCKCLINTHNHRDYYVYALIEKDDKGFLFDSNEDYEEVADIIASYYMDVNNTDHCVVGFGNRYIEWLREKCTMQFCYNLIVQHHCYDPKIWERALTDKHIAVNVRTHLMENVLCIGQRELRNSQENNDAFSFLLLFARGDFKGQLVGVPYAEEYNKAYLSFFTNIVEVCCNPERCVNSVGEFVFTEKQMQSAYQAIAKVLYNLKAMGNENEKFVKEIAEKIDVDKLCLRDDKNNVLKKAYQRLVVGDRETLKTLSIDEAYYTLCQYNWHTMQVYDLTDDSGSMKEMLHCFQTLSYSRKSEHEEIYNQCFKQVLESAKNNFAESRKEYYKYILCYNSRLCSKENRELAQSLVETVYKAASIYELYSLGHIHKMVSILGKEVSEDFVYNKILLEMPVDRLPLLREVYNTLGELFENRMLDYNVIIEQLKKEVKLDEREAVFTEFFIELFVKEFWEWQRIYVVDFVRRLLHVRNFPYLSSRLQTAILFYIGGKEEYKLNRDILLKQYIKDSGDSKLKTMFLMTVSEIPIELEDYGEELLKCLENNFVTAWKDTGVNKIALTSRILKLYRCNPNKTAKIAAMAASVLIGNIWAEIGEMRSLQEKDYLSHRIKHFEVIMSHPCIRSLTKYYCQQLENEMFCHGMKVRTELKAGEFYINELIYDIAAGKFPKWFGVEVQMDNLECEPVVVPLESVECIENIEYDQNEVNEMIQEWYRDIGSVDLQAPFSPKEDIVILEKEYESSDVQFQPLECARIIVGCHKLRKTHSRIPCNICAIKVVVGDCLELEVDENIDRPIETICDISQLLDDLFVQLNTVLLEKYPDCCKLNSEKQVKGIVSDATFSKSFKNKLNTLLDFYWRKFKSHQLDRWLTEQNAPAFQNIIIRFQYCINELKNMM